MTLVSDKRGEGQNAHFTFNTFVDNHAVYEIMWKKYGRAREAMDDCDSSITEFQCVSLK